jgi:NitT/TauT family transport system permease protein
MFRTDTALPAWVKLALGLLPFVIVIGLYYWGSNHLHELAAQGSGQVTVSPQLMPTFSEMWDGFKRVAIIPDTRAELRLWVDTLASVQRFAIGMVIVAFAGIVLGLYMGTFPVVNAIFHRFFVFFDKVPPLLLLPILFLTFGTDELSKVAILVIGVLPGVVLDAQMKTMEIQKEQFHKAQTLGASESEIAWSVIMPQIFPKMLGTLRLNFKAAWMYVLAAEMIAASSGLGYRVFVVKRYVAMDLIIPYVVWATVLMFALDFLFQWWERRYRWVGK